MAEKRKSKRYNSMERIESAVGPRAVIDAMLNLAESDYIAAYRRRDTVKGECAMRQIERDLRSGYLKKTFGVDGEKILATFEEETKTLDDAPLPAEGSVNIIARDRDVRKETSYEKLKRLERQVEDLAAKGYSQRRIADKLGVDRNVAGRFMKDENIVVSAKKTVDSDEAPKLDDLERMVQSEDVRVPRSFYCGYSDVGGYLYIDSREDTKSEIAMVPRDNVKEEGSFLSVRLPEEVRTFVFSKGRLASNGTKTATDVKTALKKRMGAAGGTDRPER